MAARGMGRAVATATRALSEVIVGGEKPSCKPAWAPRTRLGPSREFVQHISGWWSKAWVSKATS